MKRPLHDLIVLADSLNNEVQKAKKPPKQVTDPPNPDKKRGWQAKMDHQHHGKPKNPAKTSPEGTFTNNNPAQIVHDLKEKSPDYNNAQKKLNLYINRRGRTLKGNEKSKMYQTKDDLKISYGLPLDANTELQPMYNMPPGHNLDDPMWALDTTVPDNREKNVAGVLNSVQDPNTQMSSTRGPDQDKIGGGPEVAPLLPFAEPTPIDQAGAQLKDALASIALMK
jgi:hypothetical protein